MDLTSLYRPRVPEEEASSIEKLRNSEATVEGVSMRVCVDVSPLSWRRSLNHLRGSGRFLLGAGMPYPHWNSRGAGQWRV